MNRGGSRALARRPGNRLAQCPVDLESARAVAVALELHAVAPRQPRSGDPQDLPRRQVQEDRAGGGKVVERAHRGAGDDLAAERAQVGGERLRDAPRAAARDRPAYGVARDGQDQPEGRADRFRERKRRVGRDPAEEGAGGLGLEGAPRQSLRRAQRRQPEPRQQKGVVWDAQRRQDVHHQPLPLGHEGFHERAPRPGVGAQGLARRLERPLEHRGAAVVERVRERSGGVDPRQPVLGERERAQEGGAYSERVHRGERIVYEARQGQLLRARPSADRLLRLEQQHRAAGLRHRHRCGQAIGSGADHHHIVGTHPRELDRHIIAGAAPWRHRRERWSDRRPG